MYIFLPWFHNDSDGDKFQILIPIHYARDVCDAIVDFKKKFSTGYYCGNM